jgi:hypothetical protein
MNKETVSLVATLIWGTFGITTSVVSLTVNSFSVYVMVAIVTAIVGNSAHLVTMHLTKSGLEVQAKSS